MVPSQSITSIPTIHSIAIDGNVGGVWQGSLDPMRDEIISWVVDLLGVDAITSAKENFFIQTGKVFHDDESYHQRMIYFLDYFLFTRKLPQANNLVASTPFELFRQKHTPITIRNFTHSLFKVSKIHVNGLILNDLHSDEKLKIHKQSDELFDGIGKNDIFQGFIFDIEDKLILSHGLIFHPARAHRLLQKSLKEAKKNSNFSQLNYLTSCARLQLKHARLRHVDPKLVYSDLRT